MKGMTEIIAAVGEDRYREACAEAWRTAARTGMSLGREDFPSNVPHQIGDLVWGSGGNPLAKLEVALRFYEAMPCYAHCMYVSMNFSDFTEEAKALLWARYRAFLSAEDALANPVAYSLWCDFFEHGNRVREAWATLTADVSEERLLQRVLVASGPVPFPLKETLYRRLLPDTVWHYFIFRSLLHSRFDVYGSIDSGKARRLLRRLDLPAGTEHIGTLRDAL